MTRWRGDLGIALAALAVLLGWEVAALDLPLSALFGNPDGFAWRDAFWAKTVLHDGARDLAALVLLAVIAAVLRPRPAGWGDPARRAHALPLAIVLACLVAVPTIKQFTSSSCPYELAPFGGLAAYVPHWRLGVADGGPGHCFPSGHAVSAFAFFGLYFGWRQHWPGAARWALALVLLAGVVLGATQLVRGAHFASHTLWSGWLCWCIGAVFSAASRTTLARPDASLHASQQAG